MCVCVCACVRACVWISLLHKVVYLYVIILFLQHLVGKQAVHPFCNRKLTIVADDFVERDFGTGTAHLSI